MKPLCAVVCSLLILASCAQQPRNVRPANEKPAPSKRATLSRAGSSALLHPVRVPLSDAPGPHEDVLINTNDGLVLRGWIWKAPTNQRAWLVYVHDFNQNRNNGISAEKTLVPLGFNVLAYDQRAHGESEGDVSTWGPREFDDLHEAIEQYTTGPVFLVGEGMGTHPVLREAPIHKRVKGIVLVPPYSDLEAAAQRLGAGADEVKTLEQQNGGADELSPAGVVKRVYGPVLFLRAKEDSKEAKAELDAFRKKFPRPTELAEVEGPSSGALSGDEAWATIANWMGSKL